MRTCNPLAPRRWRRAARLAACSLYLGLFAGSAAAVTLNTVTVAVDDRSEAERAVAAETGLERVIGRMVGAYEGLGEDHPAADLLAEPQRLLEGFRYRREEEEGGLAVELRFDGEALRQALGEREVAVWGRYRPPILTWVAVEDDGLRSLLGPETVGASDAAILERLRTGGERRGLPLMPPTLDLEDRRALGFVDLWGGFDERLRAASQRYGNRTVVALALRRDGGSDPWEGRWTVLVGDETLTHRTGPGDLERVIGEGLNEVGRLLTQRFAAVPGAYEGQRLEVAVLGIDSVAAYLGALRRLEQTRGVEQVDIRHAGAERITAQLHLERSPEQVAEALDEADRLETEALPDAGGAPEDGGRARTYRWRP